MNALVAALLLFASPQEPEKRICWESIGIYDDIEYKTPIAEGDWIMKKFKERGHKYVKRVKEATKKIFSERGFELVECPIHRPECPGHTKDCKKEHRPDDGILKKVESADIPYHMRLKMTYTVPFNRVKLFVRIEVYKSDKLLFSFDDDESISWRAASSYQRRGEAIVKFGSKIAATLTERIKEYQKK